MSPEQTVAPSVIPEDIDSRQPPGGPDSPTLLDAQETSPNPFEETYQPEQDPLSLQSTQQRIAHRHHEGLRRRIVTACNKSGDPQLVKRAHRLAACCCCPTFRASENRSIGVNLARCRDRLCPLCARRRGWQATTKVAAIARTFDAPRLITLTLRSNNDGLDKCIRRLFACFALLRAMKGWTNRVTGGIWTLEVTLNGVTEQWHAHLHIIADGSFLPQPMLKALWHEVTGDSFIVDVRAVHDRAEAARYVAGYLSKPVDAAGWSLPRIAEYASALHGKRLMQPFGTARKVELDDDAEDENWTKSLPLCTAHTLQSACCAAYEPALQARDIIARLGIDHAIAAGVAPPTASGCAVPVEAWELEYAYSTLERLQAAWPQLPSPPEATTRHPKPRDDDRLWEHPNGAEV